MDVAVTQSKRIKKPQSAFQELNRSISQWLFDGEAILVRGGHSGPQETSGKGPFPAVYNSGIILYKPENNHIYVCNHLKGHKGKGKTSTSSDLYITHNNPHYILSFLALTGDDERG